MGLGESSESIQDILTPGLLILLLQTCFPGVTHEADPNKYEEHLNVKFTSTNLHNFNNLVLDTYSLPKPLSKPQQATYYTEPCKRQTI